VGKKCQKILATYEIFKKLTKETNHPIGENSPNLVTLMWLLVLHFNVQPQIQL
jgi:hypothetical protein